MMQSKYFPQWGEQSYPQNQFVSVTTIFQWVIFQKTTNEQSDK